MAMTEHSENQSARDQELVSVINAAEQLGMLKQSVFKVLKRLGIDPIKRRDPERRNATTSFISAADLKRVATECAGNSADAGSTADGFTTAP